MSPNFDPSFTTFLHSSFSPSSFSCLYSSFQLWLFLFSFHLQINYFLLKYLSLHIEFHNSVVKTVTVAWCLCGEHDIKTDIPCFIANFNSRRQLEDFHFVIRSKIKIKNKNTYLQLELENLKPNLSALTFRNLFQNFCPKRSTHTF